MREVAPPASERAATEPFALASLPFDLYQRHKLVQEAVERIRGERRRLAILDVGGAPGHLKAFLPRDHVVVADREGVQGQGAVLADALALPFSDGSFDAVVSLDALEHVPPRRRAAFVKEMGRVTRDALLLTAPFDAPRVAEAESILDGFLRHRLKLDHRFLGEHLANGLPDREATARILARAVGPVVAVPNGCLDRWLLMMGLSFYLDADPNLADLKRQVSAFYNRNYYRSDNAEPAYRHLLAARRAPAAPLDTAGLHAAVGEADRPDFTAMAALMEATGIDLLKEAYQSIATLQEQMGNKNVHAANLVAERDHRQRVIETLQAEIGRRQERIESLKQEVEAASEALRERGRRLLEVNHELQERDRSRPGVTEDQERLRREFREREVLLRQQSEALPARLEAMTRELGRFADLAVMAREKEAEAARLSSRTSALDAEVERRGAALAELRVEVAAARAALRQREADCERFVATLAVRAEKIARLERRVDEVQIEIDKRDGRIAGLVTGAAGERAAFGAEVKRRDERIVALDAQAKTLAGRAERLGRQVASLTGVVEARQQTLSELNAQGESLRNEAKGLRADLARAQEAARRATEAARLAQAASGARAARVAALEQHSQNLGAEVERKEARITGLERHTANLEAEVARRDRRVSELEAEVERRGRALGDLESSVAALDAHLGEQVRHAADLDLELRQATEGLVTARAELAARGREVSALAVRLETLRAQRGVRLLKRLGAVRDPD